jgi:Zn-dependent M32 family carboxypeptidase
MIKEEYNRLFCNRAAVVVEKVKELRRNVDREGMLMERMAEGVEALGKRIGESLEEEMSRIEAETREKTCVERGKVREMNEAIEETADMYQQAKAKLDVSAAPLEAGIADLKSAQISLRGEFSSALSALQDQLAEDTTSISAEASSMAFSLHLPDPSVRLKTVDSAITAIAGELTQQLRIAAQTLKLSTQSIQTLPLPPTNSSIFSL